MLLCGILVLDIAHQIGCDYMADEDKTAQESKEISKGRLLNVDFFREIGLWIICIYCFYNFVLDAPSVSSFAFLFAGLMVCPLNLIHDMPWLRDLRTAIEDMLAKPSDFKGVASITKRLDVNSAICVTSAVLIALGAATTPQGGDLSLRTYLAFQDANLTTKDSIEYSNSILSIDDIVTCSDSGISLSTLDLINPSLVGEQDMIVDMSEGLYSKSENVSVVVRDTKSPKIQLSSKGEVEIDWQSDFDPLSLVASVKDPVDGELDYVDKPLTPASRNIGRAQVYEKGWYTLTGTVDSSKPGEYPIKVIAADQFGNKTEGSCSVIVKDPLDGVTLRANTEQLEYSNKTVDPLTLVTCSDADTKVTCANEINLQAVGQQAVTYTLEKGPSQRALDVQFEVVDTKGPEITLQTNEVTITEGDGFDPYSYVTSVIDPVDGDLARVDKEQEENGSGWYTVLGEYDANKDGAYFLSVSACDRNGNRANKEIKLLVNEAPKAIESTQSSNAKHYVINTNTGKFHRPSCRYVDTIYDENRWDVTMERWEVTDMGYVPCKVCNP